MPLVMYDIFSHKGSLTAYVVTSFLLFTDLILTGTIHILTISSLHDALQLTSSNLAQLLLNVTFCDPSDAPELSSPAFYFGV